MIKVTNFHQEYKTFTIEFLRGSGETFCAIKNCKIAQGQNGSFVSGPSKKTNDGKYFNYTYFDAGINRDVLEAYNVAVMASDVLEEQKPVLDDDTLIPF